MAEQVYYVNENGEKYYPMQKGGVNEYGYATYVPIYLSDLGENFNWNPQQTKNTVEIIEDTKIFTAEGWGQGDAGELELPIDEIYPTSEKEAEEQAKEDMTGLEEFENGTTEEEEIGTGEEETSELETKQLELVNKQLENLNKEYNESGTGYRDRENALVEKEIENKHTKKTVTTVTGKQITYDNYYDSMTAHASDSRLWINEQYTGALIRNQGLIDYVEGLDDTTVKEPVSKRLSIRYNDYNYSQFKTAMNYYKEKGGLRYADS